MYVTRVWIYLSSKVSFISFWRVWLIVIIIEFCIGIWSHRIYWLIVRYVCLFIFGVKDDDMKDYVPSEMQPDCWFGRFRSGGWCFVYGCVFWGGRENFLSNYYVSHLCAGLLNFTGSAQVGWFWPGSCVWNSCAFLYSWGGNIVV